MKNVSIIGAGRVATQIVLALSHCALVRVAEIWSKSKEHAQELAERVGCSYAYDNFEKLNRMSDIYLVCVKDDVVAPVVEALNKIVPEALILHTAGSVPISVLVDAGCQRGGVFYPMQTFSREKQVDFSKIHCFVESINVADLDEIKSFALTLVPQQNIHELSSKQRKQLHLAAIFASNFVNHCCALSSDILKPLSLSFDVMLPILEETLEKLRVMTPEQAQTGPAARGDINVLNEHLQLLNDAPHHHAVYELLSAGIMKKK